MASFEDIYPTGPQVADLFETAGTRGYTGNPLRTYAAGFVTGWLWLLRWLEENHPEAAVEPLRYRDERPNLHNPTRREYTDGKRPLTHTNDLGSEARPRKARCPKLPLASRIRAA